MYSRHMQTAWTWFVAMFLGVLFQIPAAGQEDLESISRIYRAHLESVVESGPLGGADHIEIYPLEGVSSVYLAIVEWAVDWGGTFDCFGVKDGTVEWVAGEDLHGHEPITEQSILSVRGIVVPGLEDPVVEVYGQTHMGNGALHVFVLRGRTLHLLGETRAVDGHDDGATFHGGVLRAEYEDFNEDGAIDIVLLGIVDSMGGPEGTGIVRSTPCRKVLLQDASGFFREDPALRRGLPEGD
ncbi:MAG: hypothetical protein HY720_31985 [Planctomycetes bacterium]|nr:hypothetical protein [Planctomycetota bacterium]